MSHDPEREIKLFSVIRHTTDSIQIQGDIRHQLLRYSVYVNLAAKFKIPSSIEKLYLTKKDKKKVPHFLCKLPE